MISVNPASKFQGNISLIDIQGRIIQSKECNNLNTTIDFRNNNLSSGIYFIRLYDTLNNKTTTEKIIIN